MAPFWQEEWRYWDSCITLCTVKSLCLSTITESCSVWRHSHIPITIYELHGVSGSRAPAVDFMQALIWFDLRLLSINFNLKWYPESIGKVYRYICDVTSYSFCYVWFNNGYCHTLLFNLYYFHLKKNALLIIKKNKTKRQWKKIKTKTS